MNDFNHNKSKSMNDLFSIIFLLLLSFVALYPVWKIDGWPGNHDGMHLFDRVAAFHFEFQKGNFFPLWTSYGQNGYGSAFPFLYHRFFNTLAALLAFPLGSIYLGVKLAIPILLFTGGVGMYKLISKIGLNYQYALCASLLFIFSNYTISNWLIRGAVAELTAMIFIPWLLYYCIQLLLNKNTGIKIGLVLSCMFYSHIVICYYAFFIVITFYSIFLFENNRYLKLKNYFPILVTFFVVILFCSIYAIGIINYKKIYSFSVLVQESLNPLNNFPLFERYLINTRYIWGKSSIGVTAEIGRVFNLLSILFTTSTIFLLFFKKISFNNIENKRNIYFASLICIFIYIFLQTPFSALFYENIPGANFIQFPWRLLSFSTVLSIFSFCMSIFILTYNSKTKWLKNISFTSLILSSIYQVIFGLSIPINYEIMNRRYIENYLLKENLIFSEQPSEYLPNNKKLPLRAKALIEYNNDCKLVNEHPEGITKKVFDASEIEIIVEGKCQIIYNQFINPFTKISFSSSGVIESSKDRTYILTSNSELNRISIKRIGLFFSLINFFNDKENIYKK
ncbi:hypothetical protein QEJ31_14950 [Pigmentibacter sp. JX0631]|uniref:hypothetical protein n=1 Tax=Pigmentibacter sp. JX0631 TaxID=2976982 RepID=UPI0024687175|nr:hypothetical protein [Pigmentibacter sp. JX0631]WGL59827.1 hypothetical protein QEJ31_14950 [Pigmentibacter sp. JX0631]